MSWFSQDSSNILNAYSPITKEMNVETIPFGNLEQNPQNSTDSCTRPSSRMAPSNCAACYRQKTKCDRRIDGCFNCCKANIKCTYSRQEHARQKRGPYRKESSKGKLELEHKVLALEAKLLDLSDKMQNGLELPSGFTAKQQKIEAIQSPNKQFLQGKGFISLDHQQPKEIGSLLKGEPGVSSAISEDTLDLTSNNPPWMEFTTKFDDMNPLLNISSTNQTRETPQRTSQGPFNFLGFSTETSGPRYSHPSPKTILEYWRVYKERVDPMTKILHVPSFEKKIYKAVGNLQNISPGMEALLFSIYYTAVSSLSAPCIQKHQSENKESILSRYSNATKHALSSANILMSQDMLVLQALAIYLIGNREDDPQLVYSLTGVAIRMAQSMGLHQDGTTLQISPFEVEMRRRLWWNLYHLERRFAEDYHLYPFAVEHRFDTRLPSNIDDADISPEDKEFPPPKIGRTEMTYFLVDIEISMLIFGVRDGPFGKSLQEKQILIRKCHERLGVTHFQYCNTTRDLDYMIITSANLSLTRIWVSIHQPPALFNSQNISTIYWSEISSQNLLQLTIETIEYAQTLPKEARISKWWWHFPRTIHLHLATYLLVALCHRPQGVQGERAWKLFDDVLRGNEMYVDFLKIRDSTCPFSNGLKQLFAQVIDLRDKELRSSRFAATQRMVQESIPISRGRWDLELENNAFANTRKPRTPLSTPSLSSPQTSCQLTDSNGTFSANNSRRASQAVGVSGLSPISMPSRSPIDPTRDSHVFGFLTPNDPVDLQNCTYPQFQDNGSSRSLNEEFLCSSWNDILRNTRMEAERGN